MLHHARRRSPRLHRKARLCSLRHAHRRRALVERLEERLLLSNTADSSAVVPSQSAAALYVTAVFNDLLHRGPDPSGLNYWTGQLNQGTPDAQVATQLTHTDEYYRNIVQAAYQQFLGRPADPSGVDYWVGQMRDGLTDEHLRAGFIGTQEFYQHSGGNDRAWVDAMYEDLLGRAPDPGGENYWVAALARGAHRGDVAYGFAASDEREAITVKDDYFHLLARVPGPSEVAYWVNGFRNGNTNENVVAGFVGSPEYYQGVTHPPTAAPGDDGQFTVSGAQLNPSLATTVVFTDRAGHSYLAAPSSVTNSSVTAVVPAVLDPATFDTTSGDVFVSVRQQLDGSITNEYPARHDLVISNLPALSDPPGAVTDAFLSGLETYLASVVQDYQALVAAWPNQSDFASQLAMLQSMQQELAAYHEQLAPLINGQVSRIAAGQFNDASDLPVVLNTTSLAGMDRAILQTIAVATGGATGAAGGASLFAKPLNEASSALSRVKSFFSNFITSLADNYDSALPTLAKVRDATALAVNLGVATEGTVDTAGLATPEALAAGEEAGKAAGLLGSIAILSTGLVLKEAAAAIRGDNCADLSALLTFGAEALVDLGLDKAFGPGGKLEHENPLNWIVSKLVGKDNPLLETFQGMASVGQSAAGVFTPGSGEHQLVDACKPAITVNPSSFNFTGFTGSLIAPQTLSVSNTGGAISHLHYAISTSDSHLLAIGVNSVLGAGKQDQYSLGVDTSGLAPGDYHWTITVQSTNDRGVAPVTIPVSAFISSPAAVIGVKPSSLTFTSDGTSNPPAQELDISNAGSPGSVLNYSISVSSNSIEVAGAGSGSVAAGQVDATSVSVITAGLAPGTYTGSIVISSSDPRVASVTIPVTLDIGSPAGIKVTPTSGLITTELSHGQAQFSVVLTGAPSAPVQIVIDSGNEATASPTSLVFTSANWSVPQVVTLTGVSDDPMGDDGDEQYTVTVGPPQSNDPNYAALDAVSVSATSLIE